MTSTDSRAPMDEVRLQVAAGSPWTVRLLATARSTNALAAAEPLPNLVIVADHQTAGRGRLDRTWETPAGAALTFSAVVDPVVDSKWWPLVPLAAGYAVAGAVGGSVKWPNDVLLGEQKVCGILTEQVITRAHGAPKPLAVVGIGINVGQTRVELPVEHATSLAIEGRAVDRTELLGEVLHRLREALGLLAGSPTGFLNSYRGRCATVDRTVRVELPDGRVLLGAGGIDESGRLTVDTGEGREVVAAGDVVHVRHAG